MAKFAPGYPLRRSADEFERLCLKLLRRHWQLPQLERFRDPERIEKGINLIEISGRPRLAAVKCDLRDSKNDLTVAEIKDRPNGCENQGRRRPRREPEAANRTLRDRYDGRKARRLAAFALRSQPQQPQRHNFRDRSSDLGRYRGAARRVSSDPY